MLYEVITRYYWNGGRWAYHGTAQASRGPGDGAQSPSCVITSYSIHYTKLYDDNIQNTVDLFYVAAITTSILIFGDKKSKISRFDLACLGAVLLIVVFWIFTQNHLLTNFLIQSILVIAYFPVIQRMIKTRENSESFT